jgi:glyoxalase family protein
MTPQPPAISGIHFLTAVSEDAQRAVDFYTKLLGLRLLELTVAGDDATAYQLTFGDEAHGPGTLTSSSPSRPAV